jgi:hypothetical protein
VPTFKATPMSRRTSSTLAGSKKVIPQRNMHCPHDIFE